MVSTIPNTRMMDTIDKDLLNHIQREFPLTREPFEAMGRDLGLPGDEVIRRIDALKRGRVIRQISAIFDTRVLGYSPLSSPPRYRRRNSTPPPRP